MSHSRNFLKLNLLSKSKLAYNNPQYKESKNYTSIHDFMTRRIPKPETCPKCNKKGWLDLHSISNQHLRLISDWQWLCRKCHMIEDGRMFSRDEKGRFYTKIRMDEDGD